MHISLLAWATTLFHMHAVYNTALTLTTPQDYRAAWHELIRGLLQSASPCRLRVPATVHELPAPLVTSTIGLCNRQSMAISRQTPASPAETTPNRYISLYSAGHLTQVPLTCLQGLDTQDVQVILSRPHTTTCPHIGRQHSLDPYITSIVLVQECE